MKSPEDIGQIPQTTAETSGTPFTEKLVESDISEVHVGSGKLWKFENDPNKIIRRESFDDLRKRYGEQISPIGLVRIAKSLFEELESNYGVKVPVEFVIGEDSDGSHFVYSVVDKIDGKKWEELVDSEDALSKLGQLYESIARYYVDKLESGDPYLADIASRDQYVYGKKHGTSDEKIYLVDTDLYFDASRIHLYTTVEWFTRHTKGAEQDFHTTFEKARAYIKRFIEHLPQNGMSEEDLEAVEKNIENIKKFLDGKRLDDEGPIPAIPPFGQD